MILVQWIRTIRPQRLRLIAIRRLIPVSRTVPFMPIAGEAVLSQQA